MKSIPIRVWTRIDMTNAEADAVLGSNDMDVAASILYSRYKVGEIDEVFINGNDVRDFNNQYGTRYDEYDRGDA